MRSFREISIDMFELTDPIAPSNTTPTYEVRRFMKACVVKTHTGIRPYLFSKFHSRHREKRRDPNAVFDTTAFKTTSIANRCCFEFWSWTIYTKYICSLSRDLRAVEETLKTKHYRDICVAADITEKGREFSFLSRVKPCEFQVIYYKQSLAFRVKQLWSWQIR